MIIENKLYIGIFITIYPKIYPKLLMNELSSSTFMSITKKKWKLTKLTQLITSKKGEGKISSL